MLHAGGRFDDAELAASTDAHHVLRTEYSEAKNGCLGKRIYCHTMMELEHAFRSSYQVRNSEDADECRGRVALIGCWDSWLIVLISTCI